MGEWTSRDGVSNSSEAFVRICATVEQIIRNDAHSLIAGRADQTARFIVAALAHEYGMEPKMGVRLAPPQEGSG